MTRIFKPDSGHALEIQDEGGSAALTIETDGDVNLTQDIYLATGKGIYFDGGTTSANYLGGSDAYEEGVFTVAFAPDGGTVTIDESYNSCRYVKIGQLVHIQGYLKVTGTPNGTGDIYVTGLPFTSVASSAGANGYSIFSVRISGAASTPGAGCNCYLAPGNTDLLLRGLNANADTSWGPKMANSTYVGLGGTYLAA